MVFRTFRHAIGWWATSGDRGRPPVWLALLPLACLPVISTALPDHQALASAVLLLVSVLAWAATAAQPGARPIDIALLATSEHRRLGGWEGFLLGIAAASAVVYLAIGFRVEEIAYNDGAYYYGVARHIARTSRFEEPIVWHFLHPPDRVLHAPFDYWGCLTSLLLVSPMVVFGSTPRVAFVTMSAISAAGLLAFWYLICFALPLRHRPTQLLALVIFALSPAMDVYRFQPESISVVQLFLLGALIALCRGRSVLAVGFGFGIFLARGDGLILFSLIVLAALFQQGTRGASGRRGLRSVLLVGFTCLGAYALWSYVSFGTLTPPGPQRLPFLTRYWQVFDFGPPPETSSGRVLDRLTSDYLIGRVRIAVQTLRSVPFAPALDWWLALALVPALGLLRSERRSESLVWVIGVAGYFLVVIVSGPGFAPFRTPYAFTPLVVLAGALGFDAILSSLGAWTARTRFTRLTAAVVGAFVLGSCFVFLAKLPVLRATRAVPNLAFQTQVAALDDLLRGETVATNVPWYLIAYTQSPAVSLPFNGAEAIAAVLAKYQVRWVVIFGHAPLWVTGESRVVLQSVLAGTRSEVGPFHLERVPVEVRAAVYRVLALP